MMLTMTTDDAADETSELPVIEFVEAIPGFPDATRFTLVRLDETGALCSLRSLDTDGLQFLVVSAAEFHPEYAPEVSDDVVTALDIASADDVLVLLVVHAGGSLSTTTVNLRAPLLVNLVNRHAAQVILDDPELSITAPLLYS